MVPEMGTRVLPGNRLSSFPLAAEIAKTLDSIASNSVAGEPVAVAVEPAVVAAEPVVSAAEPVVLQAKASEDEVEEMDFDMEWD